MFQLSGVHYKGLEFGVNQKGRLLQLLHETRGHDEGARLPGQGDVLCGFKVLGVKGLGV